MDGCCRDCNCYDYCEENLCNHRDLFYVGDGKPICCKKGGECEKCNYLKRLRKERRGKNGNRTSRKNI